MNKQLSDMTNAELWALFPIILAEHDPAWEQCYLSESAAVIKAAGPESIARISHIGSTAVNGLLAKPTIDILLEITDDCDTEQLKQRLISVGWIFTAQPDNPAPHMMFLKGYTPQGFAGQAFHLHARYSGGWNELYFRDYLKEHKDVADEYAKLKTKLRKQYEYDRDGYTNAKTEFIEEYTALAREEYNCRYEP